MKHFANTLLAVIVGILIASVLSVFLTVGVLSSLSGTTGKTAVTVPDNTVLKIDMRTLDLYERGIEDIRTVLNVSPVASVSLFDAVNAIKCAAEDPFVKYIYLRPDYFSCGTAELEELRKALSIFRQSGKPVITYAESISTGGYYLASASDKIYMTDAVGASSMLNGVSGQMFFLKDLLDRLGIKVQLIRHGKFKSAGEMYIRNSPSRENLYQQQEMVNSVWNTLADAICSSREISRDRLDSMIDNLELCLPSDFVEAGLADGLASTDGMEEILARQAMVSSFDNINMVPLDQYAKARVKTNYRTTRKIAIVYADGNIVEGDAPEQISGDYYVPILREIRKDSTIRAVVLRVNSPGGSVLASEKIRHEIDLIRKTKPVIASYGGYAASGGYWISSGCDRIFSDATTLTGSIGVFSTIPDISGTLEDIAHVGVTSVNSHAHGDMYSMTRPLSAGEEEYLQRSVEAVYDKFLDVVSEQRPLDRGEVDELGQGRVWTGAEALENALVDEIGTLDDAVSYACAAAGDARMSSWRIVSYPKALTFADTISALFADETGDFTPSVTLARMPFDIIIR